MAELTKIEWADHTWNPVEGCQQVGPGCDNCYAEDRNKRWGGGKNWGPGAPRRRTSKATWAKAFKWNREADKFEAEHDRRQRVFCASLSDLFDSAWPEGVRNEALMHMEMCDRLNWLPLTKRVGNVEKMVLDHWHDEWPQHIGLMITVVNQKEADRDIPKLLALKARFGIPWVGISYEPALGPIDLRRWIGEAICGSTYVGLGEEFERCDLTGAPCDGLDWLISGGESGPNARPAHPDWFRSVRDQCAAAGVAYLHKQNGEYAEAGEDELPEQFGPACDNFGTLCSNGFIGDLSLDSAFLHGPSRFPGCFPNGAEGDASCNLIIVRRVGKKRAGRLLDGVEHNGFPEALR